MENIFINLFGNYFMSIDFVVPTLRGTGHVVVRKYPQVRAIIWGRQAFFVLKYQYPNNRVKL